VAKLFVVRHADAGHRSGWDGPDRERPLSTRGWRQAQAISACLGEDQPRRLLASPYTRCVQTLEPLADQLGLSVEPDPRLAEGAGAGGALELADELAGMPAVLCSHGDVIPDLLEALVARGVKLRDEPRWQKASTWVLSRDGARLAQGRYVPPPH
jgi:phosphohistidine phosphatase SixA